LEKIGFLLTGNSIYGSPAIGSGKPARYQRPSRFFGEITTLFRTTEFLGWGAGRGVEV